MIRNPRKVRCIEDDLVFDRIGEAALAYGCSVDMIWKVCTGRRQTTRGLHFEYV